METGTDDKGASSTVFTGFVLGTLTWSLWG